MSDSPTRPWASGRRRGQREAAPCRVVADGHLDVIALSRDLHLMRGRVRVAETCRAVDFHGKAPRRRLAIALAEVAEAPGIPGAVEELRVLECDLASLPRGNREDTRANQAFTGELDQRGVTLLPHDRFVDRACLRGVHRFAAQLLIALPQRIAREDC